MHQEAFDVLEDTEGSWWGIGREKAIAAVIGRQVHGKNRFGTILDYGAGYGAQFAFLSRFETVIDALEPNDEARERLYAKNYRYISGTPEEALKIPHGVIVMFDVIAHIKDDGKALKDIYESLTTGGKIIITTPAFPMLWNRHDEVQMHYRRYTKETLRQKLEKAGFTVEYIGYWNMFSFLPALIIRKFGGSSGTDALNTPKFISAILIAWLSIEAFIMRFIPLPFGLSVIAKARK
jgi:SAM-dependent methyltransferase